MEEISMIVGVAMMIFGLVLSAALPVIAGAMVFSSGLISNAIRKQKK